MEKRFEYGKIERLAVSLEESAISHEITAFVLDGGDLVKKTDKPEKKAAWFVEAMKKMDDLIEPELRHAVREKCACCLGGKRQQVSKSIARNNATLEERIAASNEARFVFGHSVERLDDGRIMVAFEPEGREAYRCVCLPKAEQAVSVTYCYCCGGHVKHHLQTALGRELNLTVRSSALESNGQRPCTFLFTLLN